MKHSSCFLLVQLKCEKLTIGGESSVEPKKNVKVIGDLWGHVGIWPKPPLLSIRAKFVEIVSPTERCTSDLTQI